MIHSEHRAACKSSGPSYRVTEDRENSLEPILNRQINVRSSACIEIHRSHAIDFVSDIQMKVTEGLSYALYGLL